MRLNLMSSNVAKFNLLCKENVLNPAVLHHRALRLLTWSPLVQEDQPVHWPAGDIMHEEHEQYQDNYYYCGQDMA